MKLHTTSRNWTKWLAATALAFVLLGTAANAATVDGFVTKVDSPTEFDVGTSHVVMDGKTQCKTEILHSIIGLKEKTYAVILAHRYFALQDRLVPSSIQSAPCNSLSLKVGDQVQIVADARHGDGSFWAAQVVRYTVRIIQSHSTHKWRSGALLEERPQISRTEKGWGGTLWLDGYPMSVTPDMDILTASTGTQMSYRHFELSGSPRMGAVLAPLPLPKISASLWQPNTWATYRGAGMVNGRVLLYRIRLWPNQINTSEQQFWTKFTPAIHEPDYRNHIPGTVKSPHTNADKILRILPDQNVQDFVSKLGTSLIPQYQKDLPESDATKVHFRFYIVQTVGTTFNDEMRNSDGLSVLLRPSWDEAVVALPSGQIFVPENMLADVDNEAELAAIFSHAITSVLQKHSYIALHSRPYNCSMFCSG